MECHGRRGRRNRNHSRQQPIMVPFGAHNFNPGQSKPWSFLSGLYSLFIMTSLMALIYLMLEYHCTTCTAKGDMSNITKNIDEISKNLSHIKQSYHELEIQISKFSQEMPKLEGQIEILEALANTMDNRDFGWNPKPHHGLPNVEVYLSSTEDGKNISCLAPKTYPEMLVV